MVNLILLAVLFYSAYQENAAAQDPDQYTIASDTGILYLPKPYESDYATRMCRLDVYYPEEAKEFPVIVYFHGGGLRAGSRHSGGIVVERFVPEGIAVINVGYRFSPKVQHPVYIEDAAAAIAWAFKNVSKYGGDPDKVFVSGHSAGGYLTMITGMDVRYLGEHGISNLDLAGLMPISGQTITHSTIRQEMGLPDGTQFINEFGVLYHANRPGPPCICICGSEDLPLRCMENIYFVEVQKNAGNKNVSYLEVEGRDHGTIYTKINESGDVVAEAMLEFIRRILNDKH